MLAHTDQGPLAGIHVVEFAGIGPGPFAAMLLADLGAEVVRIDRPSDPPALAEEVLTRNRIRIRADLKRDDEKTKVLDLIENADILIEGYRPGVMERLGLGPDVALAKNPNLVYGRVTGWGQTGPLAPTAGHDINYIAITGALHAIGSKEHPVPPLNLVGDYGGALYLVVGVLSALLAVRHGAPGQVIDAAMCDGAASMMSVFTELAAQGEWRHQRASNFLDGGAPYYRVYECADGKHVSVGPLEPQFYALLCERIGYPCDEAARNDPGNWPRIVEELSEIFRSRSSGEWEELLGATDACFASVLSLAEAPDHPHLVARQTFIDRHGIAQPAPAPRFSATPAAFPKDFIEVELAGQAAKWSAVRLTLPDSVNGDVHVGA